MSDFNPVPTVLSVSAMASEIRALKANNAELGTSLEAALKRIDELNAENTALKVAGGTSAFAIVGAMRQCALNERQRIINMLTRRASQLEDSGDLAESAALSDAVHAIEQLQHLGQDGDPFVAVEAER